ncbi:hypothetical protein [Phormidium sp. CCY1219]|uniref:hypothetical protein n=1 Tax=Phormidium sp. CCY1219 TaxID=2886104 RepID=UPI002D1EE1C8|nr:hypothetical protein [Phormidium sp. CCY1219]MEB3828570.1 hypothetical protein [Phormidium sp. CCY1219]
MLAKHWQGYSISHHNIPIVRICQSGGEAENSCQELARGKSDRALPLTCPQGRE